MNMYSSETVSAEKEQVIKLASQMEKWRKIESLEAADYPSTELNADSIGYASLEKIVYSLKHQYLKFDNLASFLVTIYTQKLFTIFYPSDNFYPGIVLGCQSVGKNFLNVIICFGIQC